MEETFYDRRKIMKFTFPEINPTNDKTLEHYTERVKLEADEFEQEEILEKKAMEAVDILHAAETVVRKFFKLHPELNLDEIVKSVISKNTNRGYYQ